MQRLSDPGVRAMLSGATGISADALARFAVTTPAQSLLDDLARLRASSLVPAGLPVVGLRYAHDTGEAAVAFSEVL